MVKKYCLKTDERTTTVYAKDGGVVFEVEDMDTLVIFMLMDNEQARDLANAINLANQDATPF